MKKKKEEEERSGEKYLNIIPKLMLSSHNPTSFTVHSETSEESEDATTFASCTAFSVSVDIFAADKAAVLSGYEKRSPPVRLPKPPDAFAIFRIPLIATWDAPRGRDAA